MPLILDSPPATPEPPPNPAEERRRLHHDADVVIVGAGILGCALAVALADQGRSVILLEKSLKEPDRIVGELLQPGGVHALEELGLRHCLEEIDAIKVKGYNVIYYGEGVEIPYSFEQPRPEGRSFHHGRFVAQLRKAAMRHSNISVFETTVTSIVTSERLSQVLGVESLTNNTQKDYFFGALTVVSDGYSSKFRKSYVAHKPTSRSRFWGLELIDTTLPLPEHGTVVLSAGAPILLYQIGTHETRILIDVPENTPSAAPAAGGIKSHLRHQVLPTLPEPVKPAFRAALESAEHGNGGLRSMPNSFLPPSTNKTPGLIVLGDALNMRHPLTGGGMTVAFNDVVLLRDLLRPVPDLSDTRAVLGVMRAWHWRRKSLTAVINILAQALYSLFAAAADDPNMRVLQRGCFRYFERGGVCVSGPVGLLAGLIRQPMVLVYHFFSVAVLAIQVMVGEMRAREWVLAPVRGLVVLWSACVVIFPYIFAELKT